MGLFTLTLVLQLGGVDDGVRFVDRVVAMQAAVVRHSCVPIDKIFIFANFICFLCTVVLANIDSSAYVPMLCVYEF